MPDARGIRAGAAYVELFVNDNKLTQGLKLAQAKLRAFSGSLARLGSKISLVGGLSVSPLLPALETLNEQGKLAGVGEAFGLSAEKATRLFGIMKSGGSDLRDATEGLVTFNQRINDALSGNGEEATRFFEGLGVSARDFVGLDTADRFFKLIEALKALPDPAQRVQLLLKAVGEDTGKNLIPLLSMTEEELQTLGDAFEQSGADLETARESSRAYTLALAQISRAWREVVTAVAPLIRELSSWISTGVQAVVNWLRENRELVQTLALVAGGVLGVGLALMGLSATVGVIGSALGGLISILSGVGAVLGLVASGLMALLTPIGFITAALVGLGYLFVTETEAGRKLTDGLRAGFTSFAETAKAAWVGIVDAIRAGDLGLAARIALSAINLEWSKAVLWWSERWLAFKSFFVDAWHDMVAGLRLIWWDFIAWFGSLLGGIVDLIAGVFDFIGVREYGDQLRKENRDLNRDNLNLGRDAIKNEILQDRSKRQRANNAARQAELQGLVDDIKKAGEALQQSLEEAARKRGALPEKMMVKPKQEMPSLSDVADLRARVDVQGTFNAEVVRRLGGESLNARAARAVEEINQNLKKVLLEAQQGGLVFA